MHELPDDGAPMWREQFVKLAQAGDSEAFTTLFTYYRPGLCLYLRGMVRYHEDGDELAQETFLKAWKALPQLKHASKFKPWLYRIANNAACDYWRHQKSQGQPSQVSLEQHLEECEVLDDSQSLEEYVVQRDLVERALMEVPLKERNCLLLEIEGKLSRDEIAEVVEISPSSVGTYISQARAHFRQAYQSLNSRGGHSHE